MKRAGVISPTCLRAAFRCTDPKGAKRQLSHQCFLALLGYVRIKTVCKMLVKLTSGSLSRQISKKVCSTDELKSLI